MNDGDREILIRDSIKACQKKGLTLSKSTWGIAWSKKKERWEAAGAMCCALGCVVLHCQEKLSRKTDWRAWTVESILDVNGEWIRNFQLGFDGYDKSVYDDGSFAYELGSILREELISEPEQLKLI